MDDHPHIIVPGGSPLLPPEDSPKQMLQLQSRCCSLHVHALIRSITHIHTHRCPYMRHWALRMFAQGPELALPADHADMLLSNARTVLTERKVMLGTCPMCDHTLLYPSHTLSLSPPPTTSPLSLSHRHHTPPSPTDTTPAPSQRPRMTSQKHPLK